MKMRQIELKKGGQLVFYKRQQNNKSAGFDRPVSFVWVSSIFIDVQVVGWPGLFEFW
jgi:hypothetical protein